MAASRREQQLDPASHVVTLRCRACDKEMPYRVSEATEFEGTPRPRVAPARDKSGRSHGHGGFSRAANA